MTRLCVSIMVESAGQALARAAQAAEGGAEMVEYRIDRFTGDPTGLGRLIEQSPLPCIVTCRPRWEGGQCDLDESARLALLDRAAGHRPAYLDVELAALEGSADWQEAVRRWTAPDATGEPACRLILSSHDFAGRPADLLGRFERILQFPQAAVAKLAWTARSLRDNIEAFELLADSPKPAIALCMGRFGQPSRLLAGKFGAMLTFACLDDQAATAPGQVDLHAVKRLYRWDRLTRRTRVYGVIGWPVGHSLSPHIHNAAFEHYDLDAVYLPLPVPDDYVHFKATVSALLDFKPLDFAGASVTIPHKHHLLQFVQERGGQVDDLAQAIGAANTLVARPDGQLVAANTDCPAIFQAVCSAMGITGGDVRGLPVAVIGAGGAGRAAAAAFAQAGARLTLYNRTLDKAQRLARRFAHRFAGSISARPLADLPASSAVVYINCTSLGMWPNVETCPIDRPLDNWTEQTVVFDTVYNPLETRLLALARQAGCITINGLEMFVRQAADQFTQWTGQPAPVDLFRRIALEQLKPAT